MRIQMIKIAGHRSLCMLALCWVASFSALAETANATLADSVTEADKQHPLGWQDSPESTAGAQSVATSTQAPCDNAAYSKPEVHGMVSAGVATGSRMGTVTGEAGAVSLTKRLGDCTRPTATIGIGVETGRINGDWRRRGP